MQWEKGAKTGSDFFVFMSVFGFWVFYEIEMDRICFSCVSFWPQFILCKLESYFLVFYEFILSCFTACIESDNLGLLSFFLMNWGALGSSLMVQGDGEVCTDGLQHEPSALLSSHTWTRGNSQPISNNWVIINPATLSFPQQLKLG